MYYSLVRKALFRLDPERAHDFYLSSVKTLISFPISISYSTITSCQTVFLVWDFHFKNPLGLAAGLDKNGDCIDALGAMGFGFY